VKTVNQHESFNGRNDADTFEIRASLRSIMDAARHNRRLVLLTCIASLAIVSLYVAVWPPVYTAEATIMAEPDYDYQRDSFYTGWRIFRKDEARTEIELVTSGQVLAEVVRREGLTYDDVYHPFFAHAAYLWEKSYVGRQYRKVKASIFGDPSDADAPSAADLELGRTVASLAAGLDLAPVGESNVGRLKVKGPSRRVAKIANTVLDVYLERRVARHQAEARSSYEVLQSQVANASRELDALSQQRVAFSQKHMLTFDFQKEGLDVAKLAELENSMVATHAKIASDEASLREVEAQLAIEPQTRTISTVSEVNGLRENTKAKRLELQMALITQRERFREDSPEVQELQRALGQLDTLAGGLAETVEKATTQGLNIVRQDLLAKQTTLRTDLAGARASLAVMQESASAMRARLTAMPALQNELQELDRNLAAASEQYKQLLVKKDQAQVSLATAGGTIQSIRVVDYAVTPGSKIWPKPKLLYPGALVLGLVLGVALAVIKSETSGRILREHVEHGRGALPLYGMVAVAPTGRILLAPSGHAATHGNGHGKGNGHLNGAADDQSASLSGSSETAST
jgi:uncharacterized protein involved in exopolysaccharide biosynthesis